MKPKPKLKVKLKVEDPEPMDVDPPITSAANPAVPHDTSVITTQPARVPDQHPDQQSNQHLNQNHNQCHDHHLYQTSPGQNDTQEVNSLKVTGSIDEEQQKKITNEADVADQQKKGQMRSASASAAASAASSQGPPTNTDKVKPSAPLDVAWILVKVDWAEDLPQKWKHQLRKALQTWCNCETNEKCNIEEFKVIGDGRTAEVGITPSTDFLTALKGIKTASITLKQFQKSATVHFQHIQGPTAEPINEASSPKVTVTPTTATDKNQPEPMKDAGAALNVPGHTEMIEASDALTVPPSQYFYLSQVYNKEMEKIWNEFGVKIRAETHISISAEKPSEKSESDVRNAAQAFISLYHDKANNLKFVNIPQTYMESDVMKHVLQNIPNEEHKIMLNMSANNHLLIGPDEMTSVVAKRLHLEPGVKEATSFSNSKSDKMGIDMNPSGSSSKQNFHTLDMDITDTRAAIEMDEAHQKLLEGTFNKEISEFEKKYGVQFHYEPGQGSIKVSARSRGTHQVNLEAHALRALTHLYQKVVTSAVTCDLKDGAFTEKMSQRFEKICSEHNCIGRTEINGSWKLLGLPKNLVPAIVNIEKLVGHPVLDEKTKKLLRYLLNFRQAGGSQRGQVGMDVMRGAHGTDLRGGTERQDSNKEFREKVKESGKEKEEDYCPICLDTFIEKSKLICGHEFCKECMKQAIKNSGQICPLCKKIFGTLKGNQPQGTMTVQKGFFSLPGFPHCHTIQIDYSIPGGIQTDEHPNPGKSFSGTRRTAYLPDNSEGNHVLNLLQRAFDQRLIFTVGFSRTTGAEDMVIWNDIHHKTNIDGGPQRYGYPDPDYLKRVKEELKAKGIM
ncbi:E3 ubiquitin-protein ligase DTX3L isoform X4 [Silurus meridionalis]|nr:E3 ubiquitin-protein ligase DTX3L isoform X4 [Silurus meridionalis]